MSSADATDMAAAEDPPDVNIVGVDMEPPAPGVPDDSHLPKSASSAMPDLDSSSVPRLKARVHQRLSADECAQISLTSLEYRALQPDDFEEMVALHTEWFPVAYDDGFYNKSVRGEIFTLAAIHSRSNGNAAVSTEGLGSSSSSSSAATPAADSGADAATPAVDSGSSSSATTSGRLGIDYDLLGIITMSTGCEHHSEDILSVLGSDCASNCKRGNHGKDSLMANGVSDASGNRGALAYILTLGVVDGYRRKGLAKELLRRSIQHVEVHMPEVQAVYLHVVTYNEAAIQLYESMRFVRLDQFINFYNLHGKPYDSFLYARYLLKPNWRVRIRNFYTSLPSLSDWMVSAWTYVWSPRSGTFERKSCEVQQVEEVENMTPP